ncbi:hypothetical protein DIZ76_013195 [Coccidioides immitis]|nr:hypothetical protein DIZ76_013195 [Coccidioides immitis]
MPARIRVIGSLNADMVTVTPRFPGPGETLTATSFNTSAGGKGANQAVACGRLSRSQPRSSTSDTQDEEIYVEMIGAVGRQDSYFSTLLKPTLEQSGVDIARIREVDGVHTGIAVIVVDSSAGGENRILLSPGANYAGMQPTADLFDSVLSPPRPDVVVVQAEIPLTTVVEVLRRAGRQKEQLRKEGIKGVDGAVEVVFNPAPAPAGGLPTDVYAAIDHLIMNETECDLMAPKELRDISEPEERRGQIANHFHSLGVRKAQDDVKTWIRCINHIPAAKVEKVVDTTGAGDTFVGGYSVQVARWREQRRLLGKANECLTDDERRERYHKGIEEAIRWAVRASAQCVQRQGAMDSIPWKGEI